MTLRNYVGEDIAEIQLIDPLAGLQIQYHRGVSEENAVCAEEDGSVIGVGFLTLYRSLGNGKLKVTYSIFMREDYRNDRALESLLLDGLQNRFRTLQKELPDQNVYLVTYCEPDETEETQLLLTKGFSISAAIPVMKYDLTQDIQHNEIPADVRIQEMTFDETSMAAYLRAEFLASADLDTEAEVWFRTGNPSFRCYAAKCGDEIVGAVSVWNLSEERGATENIFVVPEYRHKNIARELVTTALEELKGRGLKTATLSLTGTNLPAMKLYLSIGYQFYYYLIELRLD